MFVEASSSIRPAGVEPYDQYKGAPRTRARLLQITAHSLHSRQARIDLIITLGGDGTILHASSLFNTGAVPPVLSFSMGTLGFLLPFHINSLPMALDDVFSGTATVLPRMRLACTFHDEKGKLIEGVDGTSPLQVMNEITLHRGRSPHLTVIDAYVGDAHLTEAVGDGLIVSTPTGSTAYSLSCGGPIVHPSARAIVMTPICPRSLSFRSLVLPSSSGIRLTAQTLHFEINPKSRAPAEISMDGQAVQNLNKWASQDNWVRDINNLLLFNASFRSSAVVFGKEVR
ncbi:ATP-NAD kinase [Ceratobasidium sp. AG-Ba]|nr:ATP-NAD kinase [Ceratobasidium sp. AG-Ba]